MVDMSAHFTAPQLLRYVAPSVAMMVFTSVYSVVDGLFVTNFVGKTAFAAVNLIMPFIMILGTLGFMMGAGGSALVAKTRGEGDDARANALFSLIVYVTLAAGAVLALTGFACMESVARLLGASEDMLPLCTLYGRISMLSLPLFMIQYALQVMASTAGKPKVGLYATLASGCTNMVLDLLFVGVMGWGVTGAAAATVASEFLGGSLLLAYFARPNASALRLGRAAFDLRALAKTCANGSSEMMASIAMSVVSVVYNLQLMAYLGEDGVAAYSIICYLFPLVYMLLFAVSQSAQPIISYNHGAGLRDRVRHTFRFSLLVGLACGVVIMLAFIFYSQTIVSIFVDSDEAAYRIASTGLPLYATGFFFMALNVCYVGYCQSIEQARAAVIFTMLRGIVFMVACFLLLPITIGTNGLWLAIPLSETLTTICILGYQILLYRKKRKQTA